MRWKIILLYGITLGFFLVFLQYSHYKLMVIMHAKEAYIALIAILFTGLGIWAGNKRPKRIEPSAPPLLPVEIMARCGISPREYEVLELMAAGRSNQEIADQLFLSLHTIKTHASNILSKLDAQRRTQAIQKAKEMGLLPSH